jgi:hypothetical protein
VLDQRIEFAEFRVKFAKLEELYRKLLEEKNTNFITTKEQVVVENDTSTFDVNGKKITVLRLPKQGRKRVREEDRIAKIEEVYKKLVEAGEKTPSANMIIRGKIGVNNVLVKQVVKRLKTQ